MAKLAATLVPPCRPSLLAGRSSVNGGDDLTLQGGHWSAHDLLCAFESIDENIEAYLLTGGSRGSRDDA